MWKYIRILRLQDQYIELGAALAGGIVLHIRDWQILWWGLTYVLVSIPAYIINEVVDRNDTDTYSWNTSHIRPDDDLDMSIVWTICIAFSCIGLSLSWALGFFWWGFAIWALGIGYSVEPFRFKRRVFWDLFIQLVVWWVLPFVAIALGGVDIAIITALMVITCLMLASVGFPYQLADFEADRLCGLHNTHVSLGLKGSSILGLYLGMAGLALSILFGFHRWAVWTVPFILLTIVVLWMYGRWYRMNDKKEVVTSIQRYVCIVKPVSRFIVPFLFILWRLS